MVARLVANANRRGRDVEPSRRRARVGSSGRADRHRFDATARTAVERAARCARRAVARSKPRHRYGAIRPSEIRARVDARRPRERSRASTRRRRQPVTESSRRRSRESEPSRRRRREERRIRRCRTPPSESGLTVARANAIRHPSASIAHRAAGELGSGDRDRRADLSCRHASPAPARRRRTTNRRRARSAGHGVGGQVGAAESPPALRMSSTHVGDCGAGCCRRRRSSPGRR